MFRVGLTGGIASGKSTVAALFAALGVPVIDTDQIAREVVAPGSAQLPAIQARFGTGVVNPAGELNRAALRQIVFQDPAARRDLEALLHPAIREEVERRSRQLAAADPSIYQMIAIPLLVEGGRRIAVDRVLLVDCPVELQIRRVMARDAASEAQARAILDAQATRAQRLAVADDVIVNDGELAALRDRVWALHQTYRAAADPAVYGRSAARAK
jgi:dephospho-CoA kinase